MIRQGTPHPCAEAAPAATAPPREGPEEELSADTRERLRAVGYLEQGPAVRSAPASASLQPEHRDAVPVETKREALVL